MSLVQTTDLKKEYIMGRTHVPALRGVNLTISKGDFMAVWGPSGSGKTTLLNLIGAIDAPSGGRLMIADQDVQALSDNALSEFRGRFIGFVFQGFNLIPVMTALENVMLPLQIRGVAPKKARQKALKNLDLVGISNFAHHRPDNMSGGQQQRVAIARALITEPALVIADEPTANLDKNTSKKIVGLMRDLNREVKTTFIFSTHDQRLLDQVDRLIRLEDGQIVNGGKPNGKMD
jgi:putative ABC transport system ATP-binding protein